MQFDRTIPATDNHTCPKCKWVVPYGSKEIVRFNTEIYHRRCFMQMFFACGKIQGNGKRTKLTKRFDLEKKRCLQQSLATSTVGQSGNVL